MNNIKYNTDVQKVVVEARLKMGYEFIGYFTNLSGISRADVGIVKKGHRMHINALGYDSYYQGVIYKEVK